MICGRNHRLYEENDHFQNQSQEVPCQMEMDPTFREYLKKHRISQVAAYIANCKAPDREILKLRFLYDLKPSEIAMKTGIPVSRVYEIIKAGKKNLKKEWGDDDE